jgi:hypothetical protein
MTTYMFKLCGIGALDIRKRYVHVKNTVRNEAVQLSVGQLKCPLFSSQWSRRNKGTYTSQIPIQANAIEVSAAENNSSKMLLNDLVKAGCSLKWQCHAFWCVWIKPISIDTVLQSTS